VKIFRKIVGVCVVALAIYLWARFVCYGMIGQWALVKFPIAVSGMLFILRVFQWLGIMLLWLILTGIFVTIGVLGIMVFRWEYYEEDYPEKNETTTTKEKQEDYEFWESDDEFDFPEYEDQEPKVF